MLVRSVPKHEAAIAIGAFDEGLIAHLQEHTRMAERAIAPITTDAGVVNRDDFGRFDGHGTALQDAGRIIATGGAPATLWYKPLWSH
jgi:hypothetical protein